MVTYPEIRVLSLISAVLTLVPLTWYFHARNIAAVAIGIWPSVINSVYAVDTLVWAVDADMKASVWYDICSSSLITGSRIALPAGCLSICINLERLAAFCETSTPQAKRRRIIFEHLMCLALPGVYIALHLVVQPRRFDLFYGFGCRPATYPTIATIFLVMIRPFLLTVATFVCAGIAWRHFLVHGIQFYGKRGSISLLTCNLYVRLVGMAILEAVSSAVLISVVMWGVLSPGLAPIRNMSRDLSEVLVWDPEAIIKTVRTSFVFFGLFACRMEVVRKGWELITIERGQRFTDMFVSITVPTLAFTEVDLSLVIQSASTLTPYGRSEKSLPLTPSPSRPPPLVEDAPEEAVISAIAPAMAPLESPSRASAIASSHNSFESNFDPNRLVFPPDPWPRTPRLIPARLPHAYVWPPWEQGGYELSQSRSFAHALMTPPLTDSNGSHGSTPATPGDSIVSSFQDDSSLSPMSHVWPIRRSGGSVLLDFEPPSSE
ncbi:Pheromone A receptor domain containing protein [Tylopilus felleus]